MNVRFGAITHPFKQNLIIDDDRPIPTKTMRNNTGLEVSLTTACWTL